MAQIGILSLVAAVSFLLPAPLAAKTITVGVGSGKLASISGAIKEACEGDRILIEGGSYRQGEIIVNKRRLSIEGNDLPVLDAGGHHQVMKICADGVRISGLAFRNTGVSHVEDRAAVRFENVDGGSIENCILQDNLFGIYLARSKNCLVRNNQITGASSTGHVAREGSAGNGIHLWQCRSIIIEGNSVRQHRDGIYLEFASNSRIKKNLCRDNLRYGLHFMFSDRDEYIENTFERNGAGVAVMYSRDVSMIANNFLNNWGTAAYGLLMKDLKNSKVEGNLFASNTTGIQCDGMEKIVIENNDFKDNGHAISMSSYCSDSVLQHNNFMGNFADIVSSAASQACQVNENFWDSHDGFDLDHDGIADQPYQPVKFSSWLLDRFPISAIVMRSPLFDLLDFAERALPAIGQKTLADAKPLMKRGYDGKHHRTTLGKEVIQETQGRK